MSYDTSGDIAVVKQAYVLEEAYEMGHSEFSPLDPPEDAEMDLAPFKDGARWCNSLLPTLRAVAGFADSGHGTFQEHRQVALVHPGCEVDEPAEADLVDAHIVYQALVSAYDMGAYDGWEGTYDPDSAQHEL